MKNKIIKLFLFLGFILVLLEGYLLISNQKISVGVSESLPFHVFLVNTNKKI